LVTAALEAGITDIIMRSEDQEFAELGRFRALFVEGENISLPDGRGLILDIHDPEDQERAMQMADGLDVLVVSTLDWKIIPLENLIARFQGGKGMLMACATTPMEARTFLDTLETGVDGIVIDVVDPSAVPAFKADDGEKTMDLEVAKVLEVRNLGMGDRVCIDTCSLMAPGEGMLVGSQSGCLFLVQSESESSGYVAPRPFRVNAGAVHSYVMGSDGRTRYLSEVSSGDTLLLVDREGGSREVIVGRCKVEKRPLLLLRARVGELEYTTILQNAETVRMCTPNGSVSVSEIAPGDELLVMAEEGGRHFGMSVQESIQEL